MSINHLDHLANFQTVEAMVDKDVRVVHDCRRASDNHDNSATTNSQRRQSRNIVVGACQQQQSLVP
jgi:hypothetical protein